MFKKRAHGARRPFGAQGDRTAALILKGVHLFLHHIRGVSDRTGKQLRMLKNGGSNFFETEVPRYIEHRILNVLVFVHLRRQYILCAFDCLGDQCHV